MQNPNLEAVLKISKPKLPAQASALEMLEAIGTVDVGKVIFGRGMRVGVDIGQFHDARLSIWGEGHSISAAAEACLAKVQRTGLFTDAPGMVPGLISAK